MLDYIFLASVYSIDMDMIFCSIIRIFIYKIHKRIRIYKAYNSFVIVFYIYFAIMIVAGILLLEDKLNLYHIC